MSVMEKESPKALNKWTVFKESLEAVLLVLFLLSLKNNSTGVIIQHQNITIAD